MLEKLKLIIKYPAKLLLWSCWLGIQGFELIIGVIFRGVVCTVECIYYMARLNLCEVGSTIIKALSYCKKDFLYKLHVARYPVWALRPTYTLPEIDFFYIEWSKRKLMKLFLMVGFSPNENDPLLYTAIDYRDRLNSYVSGGWDGLEIDHFSDTLLESMKLLVEYGANINYDTREILFKELIRFGRFNELYFLIEKGADVNSYLYFTDGSCSPLQYAVYRGKFDIILLLIDKGASFEYFDIPRIFSKQSGYISCCYAEVKILRKIYTEDMNRVGRMFPGLFPGSFPGLFPYSKELGELLQNYKDKHSNEVCHDKIEPIFRNVLSKHILPKVQNEQIKNQLNNFLSGTDNSVEDISAQADIQNDLQNSRERQDEVVTIENISKAQKETEGLSISSN